MSHGLAGKKSNAEPQTVEITFKAFDYIYVPLACTWNQNDGYMIFMNEKGKWGAFLNQGWGCFPLKAKLLALSFFIIICKGKYTNLSCDLSYIQQGISLEVLSVTLNLYKLWLSVSLTSVDCYLCNRNTKSKRRSHKKKVRGKKKIYIYIYFHSS